MGQDFGQVAFHHAVLFRKAESLKRRIQHGILTLQIKAGMVQSVGTEGTDDGVEDRVLFPIYIIRISGERQQLVHHEDVAAVMEADEAAGGRVQKRVERFDFILFIIRIGFDN